MKKIALILMVFIIITNCGYRAIYSSKNFDFNIIKIEKIEKKLKNFSNNKALNQISLQINAKKQIIIISKDLQGNPARYQMIINLNLDIINDQNIKTNKNIVQKFSYNTSSNKFALNQYENEIEEILINKIINELINNLSKL